jgi:hypothetical protein
VTKTRRGNFNSNRQQHRRMKRDPHKGIESEYVQMKGPSGTFVFPTHTDTKKYNGKALRAIRKVKR